MNAIVLASLLTGPALAFVPVPTEHLDTQQGQHHGLTERVHAKRTWNAEVSVQSEDDGLLGLVAASLMVGAAIGWTRALLGEA